MKNKIKELTHDNKGELVSITIDEIPFIKKDEYSL